MRPTLRVVACTWPLALACTPAPDTGGSTVEDTDVDQDGDGWLSPEDCDDGDAQVHPGALEHCDGVDEDCDGLVDEEATDATGFLDMDGDAFGDPDAACCPGSDHCIEAAGDCDDTDPGVYTGAIEDCDQTGVDEDCDGWVDACDSDCPAPCVEVCGDGLDNDHNGRLDCEDAACMGLSACVETCGDQDDSDGDGLVGCEDWDCWGKPPCEDIVGVVTGGIAHGSLRFELIETQKSSYDYSWRSTLSMSWTDVHGSLRSNPGSGWTSGTWTVPSGSLYLKADGEAEEHYPTALTPARPLARGLGFLPPILYRSSRKPDILRAPMGAAWYSGRFIPTFNLEAGEPFGRCPLGQAGWLYPDFDQDGFGGDSRRIPGCLPSRELSWVESAADCDDGDPSIHPATAEICGNDLDDDCDGEVDELPTWYADQDGDGYGDAAVSEQSCEPTSKDQVSDNTDCDDLDATVHPYAKDVLGNGSDEDCSGWPDDIQPTAMLLGIDFRPREGEGWGGLAAVGDVDGDGLDEVAMASGAGLLLIEHPFSTPVDHHLLRSDAPVLPLALGDVNGDGRDDVGIWDESGTHSLYLTPLHQGMDPDIQLLGLGGLVPLGDNAQNGTDDLAVSSNRAIYLLDGLDLPIDGPQVPLGEIADLWIDAVGLTTNIKPLAAGDSDGDGLAELLTGERLHEATSLHQSAADAVATLPHFDSCQWSDVSGDGHEDLICLASTGISYLFTESLRGEVGLDDAIAVYEPTDTGETLEVAGDLDGDGASDLATTVSDGMSYSVSLFLGDFSGAMSLGLADARLSWLDDEYFYYGADLVGEADLDGDGRDDLVGMAFRWDRPAPDQTHGFVLLGGDL